MTRARREDERGAAREEARGAARAAGREVSVRPCAGGPLLVRGADTVTAPDGSEHAVERPVVAVCACGRSQRQPWCDGTHRYVRRD